MKFFGSHFVIVASAFAICKSTIAQTTIPLVDIRAVDPTIIVELRYAGANNLSRRALYPPGTPALVRPEVAPRLAAAQAFLRRYQYQLKIWDAYRPKSVQFQLWQLARNNDYVADPRDGTGSLHSWGVAVDATLVDMAGNPVSMPTDFDDFRPAALWHYQGSDPNVHAHLRLLQSAMGDAGFYAVRTEWWHFVITDWRKYLPENLTRSAQSIGTRWQAKL